VAVFGSGNGRELFWWCLLKDLLPYIFNKLLIIYIYRSRLLMDTKNNII
jgi:hypothetical protein